MVTGRLPLELHDFLGYVVHLVVDQNLLQDFFYNGYHQVIVVNSAQGMVIGFLNHWVSVGLCFEVVKCILKQSPVLLKQLLAVTDQTFADLNLGFESIDSFLTEHLLKILLLASFVENVSLGFWHNFGHDRLPAFAR